MGEGASRRGDTSGRGREQVGVMIRVVHCKWSLIETFLVVMGMKILTEGVVTDEHGIFLI